MFAARDVDAVRIEAFVLPFTTEAIEVDALLSVEVIPEV